MYTITGENSPLHQNRSGPCDVVFFAEIRSYLADLPIIPIIPAFCCWTIRVPELEPTVAGDRMTRGRIPGAEVFSLGF